MKKIFLASISAISILMLSGCATSTSNYAPPSNEQISNTKSTVNSFDSTWDNLVRQLSSDFFVINNIDKNSRLINLSFSSQKPSDFVNCGTTTRTFKNARGEQTYTYPTADSSEFTFATPNGHAFNMTRRNNLEGRVNIYVAPEARGTVVNVNTKYVLSIKVHVVPMGGGIPFNDTFTADLSTKTPFVGKEFSCYSTGAIEKKILNLVE